MVLKYYVQFIPCALFVDFSTIISENLLIICLFIIFIIEIVLQAHPLHNRLVFHCLKVTLGDNSLQPLFKSTSIHTYK